MIPQQFHLMNHSIGDVRGPETLQQEQSLVSELEVSMLFPTSHDYEVTDAEVKVEIGHGVLH